MPGLPGEKGDRVSKVISTSIHIVDLLIMLTLPMLRLLSSKAH